MRMGHPRPYQVHPPPPPAHAQAQAHETQAQAHETQAHDEPPPLLAGVGECEVEGGGAFAAFLTPRNPSTLVTTPADIDSTEFEIEVAKLSTLAVDWLVGAGAEGLPAGAGAGPPDGCGAPVP